MMRKAVVKVQAVNRAVNRFNQLDAPPISDRPPSKEEEEDQAVREQVLEMFAKPEHERTLGSDADTILSYLRGTSELLERLTEAQLSVLAASAQLCNCKPDQIVIHQGDQGDCFYIIIQGALAVYVRQGGLEVSREMTSAKGKERVKLGAEVAVLPHGRSVGEMAVLTDGQDRCASVVANGNCCLLRVTKASYKQHGSAECSRKLRDRREFVHNYPLFRHWPESYKALLAEQLQLREVRFGETVVAQGSPVNSVFFIISGSAKLTMDARAHYRQHAHLLTEQPADYELTQEHQEEDATALEALRFSTMTVYNQRVLRQKSGFYTCEALKRNIDVCTVGAGGLIGDVEAIMNCDSYITRVESSSHLRVYEIDRYSFVRVIVKKSPDTYNKMRAQVKDKLEFRNANIVGGVPIFRALIALFSQSRAKDERDKLLQLYASKRSEAKEKQMSGSPFYVRLVPPARKPITDTNDDDDKDFELLKKEQEVKNSAKQGLRKIKRKGQVVGKVVTALRGKEEEGKGAGKDKRQYTVDEYKELKRKMQTLGKQQNAKGVH